MKSLFLGLSITLIFCTTFIGCGQTGGNANNQNDAFRASYTKAFLESCNKSCEEYNKTSSKAFDAYCTDSCNCTMDNLIKSKSNAQLLVKPNQEELEKATKPCIDQYLPIVKKAMAAEKSH